MTPPKDTPEIFERFLPYAIALGVENRWAERFASVLAAAQAQGQQGFLWYAGSQHPWDDPTGFADSVGSSLASAISSASTAPGSSSGSGGGGSSGGGGGGGGGGGWERRKGRPRRRKKEIGPIRKSYTGWRLKPHRFATRIQAVTTSCRRYSACNTETHLPAHPSRYALTC